VAHFWESVLEAHAVVIDAAQHDRQLALTSHLPQAVASLLAQYLARAAPAGATFGPGARDTTRLAASQPALWTEVFLMNRDELLPALRSLEEPLGELERAVEAGDASLRRRAMRRITEPLRAMGAHIEEEQGDALPLTIRGGRLHALTYTTPVASAQVKSALLFAGLTGNVAVTIREPYRSRDHTERLLLHLGLNLRYENGAISFRPSAVNVPSFHFSVPGDASSAAFLIAAAVLAEGGELLVENVGVNPTRTGVLVVLERMGAHVERVNLRDAGGEPVADL